MPNRKKILIFIDWFFPGFKAGGPIKSVANIVSSLHNDFNFYIITSDRDIHNPFPYPNIELNKWTKKNNYQIAYLSNKKRKSFIINTLNQNDFDVYYFNSLYSKSYTLEPFQLIKKIKINPNIIIAPRGMLGKGALKIKPFKKKIFLIISKLVGLFKKVTWHATDTEEMEDIQTAFGQSVNIFKSPNISILAIKENPIIKNENELKLVFFSRISPKKNLFYTLEILSHFTDKNIILDIYGSIEDEVYWNKCQKFIQKNNIKAHYISPVNPKDVQQTLSNYHFLFFPTIHENYGHVIVEALAAGCGLIISNNTPWRDLNRIKVGWDIHLDNKEVFIKSIDSCYRMNQDEYNTYRNNSYRYIKTETDKQNAIEQTKKMFLN